MNDPSVRRGREDGAVSTIRGLFGKAASLLHLTRGGAPQPGADTPTKPAPPKPTTPRPTRPKPSTPKPTTPRPSGTETIGRGSSAITVAYDPRLDGDPDPGEIVWTWVPYEDDPTQGKDRPVVVIGRRAGGLVGVALTSKRHEREDQVPVGSGSWDRDRRPSYARVDRIVEVDPRSMRREGAVLDRDRFVAVVDGVRRRLGG